MYFPLSLNSWLMMAVGLLFFFGGVYYGISHPGERVLAFGLVACGVGFVFFGFTEGSLPYRDHLVHSRPSNSVVQRPQVRPAILIPTTL
jgi:hypothetical protein